METPHAQKAIEGSVSETACQGISVAAGAVGDIGDVADADNAGQVGVAGVLPAA